MIVEHEGISFVPPSEYRDLINTKGRVVVLLISPDAPQLRMAQYLLGVKGDFEAYVVPVSDSEAHLVDVVRVPRIKVFVDGVLIHNYLLNKNDLSSIEISLREMSIF